MDSSPLFGALYSSFCFNLGEVFTITYVGVVLYIGHASRVMWLVIHNICEGDWRMEDISTSVCCFKFMYMYKKIVEQQMTNP